MLSKKFVLDTNVILSDPLCIYKFENNEVHIPLIVIEEVDKHKKGQEEKARNARTFSREIDSLREQGKLSEGIDLKTGGKLFLTVVKDDDDDVPLGLNLAINDDLILYTAFKIDAIVVSQDLNVRLKADAINVLAETYEAGKVKVENDTLYSGYRTELFSTEDMQEFRASKFLPFSNEFDNEYLILKDQGNTRSSALGRYSKNKGGIVPLISSDNTWGINPKNAEQRFALDALLNDDIKLVSLIGKAGTGKTLLAVAAGLAKTIESNVYKRMLISRPVVPMGKDIGYLPGDIKEKLDPWMQPIYDNLDHLFGEHGQDNQQWKNLLEKGIIKIEALTYIRGRSIPNQYLIVDEAQNLSPHEIKTIVTRVGEGTKVVLTGDTDQIDSPYLDAINNGLTYVVDRLKREDIVAHIELKKGERSKLADIATKLL
jgi:PhoH-like ATPase